MRPQLQSQTVTRIILLAMGVVFVALVSITSVKFDRSLYNGLDLAIFQQTLFLTSNGIPFGLTIHPHSYLGDHAALALAPLSVLLAFLGGSGKVLLLLQSLALVLGAWPLYQFARRRLGHTPGALFALGYLVHPFVWNIALFEFHLLAFAIPVLFWAVDRYDQNHFWPFVFAILTALTIREDVALVVAAWALLSLRERRPWRWWVVPGLLGTGWFVGALALARHFNPDGAYKFLAFYGAYGETPADILLSPFTHPLTVLQNTFTVGDLLFLLGAFAVCAFLPFGRLRWLFPALPIFAQLMLPGFSPDVILLTHYTALLVPFLFAASVTAYARIQGGSLRRTLEKIRLFRTFANEGVLGITLLILLWLYNAVFLGPIVGAAQLLTQQGPAEQGVARIATAAAEPNDEVAAGYALLPAVAQRSKVHALHYAFIGTRQYTDIPYHVPETTDVILMDTNDFLFHELQYEDRDPELFTSGDDRLRSLLKKGFTADAILDRYIVFHRRTPMPGPEPYTLRSAQPDWARLSEHAAPTILLVGFRSSEPRDYERNQFLPVDLVWQATEETGATHQMRVRLLDADGESLRDHVFAFAHGLYPTHELRAGDILQTSHAFLLPSGVSPVSIELTLVDVRGTLGIDGVRSVRPIELETTAVGDPVLLPIREVR